MAKNSNQPDVKEQLKSIAVPLEEEELKMLKFLVLLKEKSIKEITSDALEDYFKTFPFLNKEKNDT
ncbi:MAG: hypothetical protein P0S95_07715 [Rhabdochlamydiaceae bacterium]|nr:hypothetical protein [Candidatus Amphrikana amoebophyrae]